MPTKHPITVTAKRPRRTSRKASPKLNQPALPTRIVTGSKPRLIPRQAADDEEPSESVKAFFKRMIRPPG